MKFIFKKDARFPWSEDFWFDIAFSKYIDPHKLLENKNVADEVNKAVKILCAFFEALTNELENR